MKKYLLLIIGLTLLLIFSGLVNAKVLSHTASLDAKIPLTEKIILLGEIDFSGDLVGATLENPIKKELEGIPDEFIPSYPFIENIRNVGYFDLIPILTERYTLEKLNEVIVFNSSSFGNQTFTNVSLTVDNKDIFSMIAINGTSSVSSKLDSTICALTNVNVEGSNVTALIASTVDNSTIKIHFSSSISLVGFSPNGNTSQIITIKDSNGNIAWNGYLDPGNIIIVNDRDFFLSYKSKVKFLPLSYENGEVKFHIKLSPSETVFDASALLKPILEEFSKFSSGGSTNEINKSMETFKPFISSFSPFINGALVAIGENLTLNIDGSLQESKKILLTKGDFIDISLLHDEIENKNYASVNGKCSLIFLGDHFYTTQAKESEKGVPPTIIPVSMILLWIIAVIVYALFKFFIKRDVNEILTEKLKKPAFVVHILLIILAFILLDMEISYQFGSSILSSLILLPQGSNVSLLSIGIVAGLQLSVWCMGALVFALPIRAIVNSLLSYFGVGKDAKGIGKGIGALFIWILGTVYLKIFANIFMMILLSSGIMPTSIFG